MSQPTQQDVVFLQSSQQVLTFDSSLTAISLPKRAADFHSWSFHLRGDQSADGTAAGAKGKAQVIISNAPYVAGALVAPAAWVEVPELVLNIGGEDSCPAFLRCLFNDCGWVALRWIPGSGSSGNLAAWFDGVRR